MSRRDDVIWAAGFFDGEGCVSIFRNRRGDCTYHSLSISAFQNVREPLDTLSSLFGGGISVRPEEGWIWTAYGPKASSALAEMLPFLRVKDLQAAAAVGFQTRKLPKGGKYPDAATRRAVLDRDAADWADIRDLKQVQVPK